MKRKVRASLAFDARCYALRYDEQLSIMEIVGRVEASKQVVRAAIRRHAERLGETVDSEQFGRTRLRREESMMAARALDNGTDPAVVLAQTSYPNQARLMANTRRYRKTRGRAVFRETTGTVTIQDCHNVPTVVLYQTAMSVAGWELGDTIEWRVQGQAVILHAYEPEDPRSAAPGDPGAVAYYHHYLKGRAWKDAGVRIGVSRNVARDLALRFVERHPELGLIGLTRSKRADCGLVTVVVTGREPTVRFSIPAIRLGWRPTETAEWTWNAETRAIHVRRLQTPD